MRLAYALTLPGLLAGSLLLAAHPARADDAAMTCDQISTEVSTQNKIVNDQIPIIQKAEAGSATSAGGPSAVTEMDQAHEAIAQRKSDKATARGKTLVALGKTKKCFK